MQKTYSKKRRFGAERLNLQKGTETQLLENLKDLSNSNPETFLQTLPQYLETQEHLFATLSSKPRTFLLQIKEKGIFSPSNSMAQLSDSSKKSEPLSSTQKSKMTEDIKPENETKCRRNSRSTPIRDSDDCSQTPEKDSQENEEKEQVALKDLFACNSNSNSKKPKKSMTKKRKVEGEPINELRSSLERFDDAHHRQGPKKECDHKYFVFLVSCKMNWITFCLD